jgi:hypothetical protein
LQRLGGEFIIEKNTQALSKQGDYYAPNKKNNMVGFYFFSFIYALRFFYPPSGFQIDPGKKAFRKSPPSGYYPKDKNQSVCPYR